MHIVIDMGGTNTRIGLTRDLKEFFVTEKFPTPSSQKEVHTKINEILSRETDQIESIVLGVAGLVDYENKVVISAPHINWIKNMTVQEITGISNENIKVFNDAELAGLAEAHQPYATNFKNVAYITISTGVGGTVIRNKKPDTHLSNYEPGHIIIDKSTNIDEPVDNIRGSFESLCSGTAFYKKYNIQPKDCSDPEIWQSYGMDLADGLYTVTILWQPNAIVLGGSMTNQWNSFYESLIERYTSYPSYYVQPTILKSELKDKNGLLGGLKILSG
jgi:glucokinase